MRSTPRRWSFQLFLAAVVMVLTRGSTGVGQASAQNGAVQPPGAISGVVLDATTKQPVRNALVQLSGPNAGGRLTDERGRFIFLGVAPGSYTLRVTKAGYFEPALFARSSPPLSVGPSQWLADQQIAIVRQGSIAGRVVDERGEPMVGARVRVFAEVPIAGRVRLARGPAAGTDDRGVYRITGLPEGRYHVVVPSVQQAVPAGTPAAVIAGQSVAQAAKSAGAAIVERPTVESASGHRLVVGSALIPPPPDGS
jgi:hypothetical protein